MPEDCRKRERERASDPELRCCSVVCRRALIAPRAVELLVESAWLRSTVHVALTGRGSKREKEVRVKVRELVKGCREVY